MPQKGDTETTTLADSGTDPGIVSASAHAKGKGAASKELLAAVPDCDMNATKVTGEEVCSTSGRILGNTTVARLSR